MKKHNNAAFNFDKMIAHDNILWLKVELNKVEILIYILENFADSLSIQRVWNWTGNRDAFVYTTMNVCTDYCQACEEVFKAVYNDYPPDYNCSSTFHNMMDFISHMILQVGKHQADQVMEMAQDKVKTARKKLENAEKKLAKLKEGK